VGLAVAVVVVAYIAREIIRPRIQPSTGKIMLAVLPFENLSGDPKDEFFSDGLTEEMIAQLGRLHPERLSVIARTSVIAYKGSHRTAAEIGRELGVDYILEGSVRRADDRVRIVASLVKVEDQTNVRTENYERPLRDILRLQSEVSQAIAKEIQLELSPQQQERLGQTQAVDPEAYELFLKGRYFWNKRTDESIQKSIEYFNQAVAKDPNYALAYAGLADSYDVLTFFGWMPDRDAYPMAKKAAEKALSLDESLAQAHATLADVKFHYDWDWEGTEKRFKRAIELNPNYATAHQWYAVFLELSGRLDEAHAEIERARKLDPLSLVINVDAAANYYYARQYDQAIAQCRKVLEMDPNFPLIYVYLGMAYLQKKDYPQAIEEFNRVKAVSPTALTLLGYAYGVSGQPAEARRVLQDLQTLSQKRYVSPAYFALVHVGLGDRDRAFRYIEEAYQKRSALMVRLKMDPLLDPLHSDPRFAAMLKKMKFPAGQATQLSEATGSTTH
jgi:TolB-like protein/Flp pilus assembly protein TadD